MLKHFSCKLYVNGYILRRRDKITTVYKAFLTIYIFLRQTQGILVDYLDSVYLYPNFNCSLLSW